MANFSDGYPGDDLVGLAGKSPEHVDGLCFVYRLKEYIISYGNDCIGSDNNRTFWKTVIKAAGLGIGCLKGKLAGRGRSEGAFIHISGNNLVWDLEDLKYAAPA